MLYDVKSSVFSSHVHCDYGHAYLTCTIWSRAKRLRQPLFHLTFWYFSLPFSVCILHHLLSFLLWRCIKKKKNQMWSDYRFLIFSKMSVPSPRKKNSVGFIFWSILYELLFRGLCVVVVFGFDIACILVTRPSFRAKLFFPGFLRNSRKISSR